MRGVLAPVITPFLRDLRPDPARLFDVRGNVSGRRAARGLP